MSLDVMKSDVRSRNKNAKQIIGYSGSQLQIVPKPIIPLTPDTRTLRCHSYNTVYGSEDFSERKLGLSNAQQVWRTHIPRSSHHPILPGPGLSLKVAVEKNFMGVRKNTFHNCILLLCTYSSKWSKYQRAYESWMKKKGMMLCVERKTKWFETKFEVRWRWLI